MKITSTDLCKILLVIVVASVLGYFLGIYALFMHTAYEVFYYALFYAVSFGIYFLGSWVVSVIQEKAEMKTKTLPRVS